MRNIVLIGLSGSGKTTVGRRLAAELGKTFVDTDQMVIEREKLSIPDLFVQKGEAHFREVEASCVREAAERENAVIATGGGVVLRPDNMQTLRATGMVFFLDRRVEDILKTTNFSRRPLLAEHPEALRELSRARAGLYRKYADCTITGNRLADVCEAVATMYEMTAE
ncbi:MAG: shikimate kinase [Oscillospiraceae bacterium]